jgi:Ca2+-binding EF-hand superfamily protein
MQPEVLAKEMFDIVDLNYSGFLNWAEFLHLMTIIKSKTLEERVNLFIKICDKDGNGSLS